MIIENVEVYGFRAALRGMRNPMESWAKSDTLFGTRCWDGVACVEGPTVGSEDMKLVLKLVRGGGAHRKFLRQIAVWWDITVPRAIWQELDTYKVATVRASCSTMHKLGSRDLVSDDFEGGRVSLATLAELNSLGREMRQSTSRARTDEILHELKMILPEGYLQKATYSFNYEIALKMHYDRRGHRMPEWSGTGGICEHLLKLPYFREIVEAMDSTRARG